MNGPRVVFSMFGDVLVGTNEHLAAEQLHIWAAIHGVTFDDLRGRIRAFHETSSEGTT